MSIWRKHFLIIFKTWVDVGFHKSLASTCVADKGLHLKKFQKLTVHKKKDQAISQTPLWVTETTLACNLICQAKAWEGNARIPLQRMTTALRVVIKPKTFKIKSRSAASLVNPVSNNCSTCEGGRGSVCNENQGSTTHYSSTGSEHPDWTRGSDNVQRDLTATSCTAVEETAFTVLSKTSSLRWRTSLMSFWWLTGAT